MPRGRANTTELLAIAEHVARAAGALLLDHASRGPVAVESKSSTTDMVSAADHASEELLVALLRAARPDDGLIGEEGAARGVDDRPDVGLRPARRHHELPLPAAAVGGLRGRRGRGGPVAACVYDPVRDESFTAAREHGASLNGQPIQTSDATELATSLIATGFAYSAELRAEQGARLPAVLAAVRDIRRAGSAALDLAWVACGRLDGFFESDIRHWDYAGGRLLVQEAGGRFDLGPGPHDGIPQVVAAAPGIHAALLALAG